MLDLLRHQNPREEPPLARSTMGLLKISPRLLRTRLLVQKLRKRNPSPIQATPQNKRSRPRRTPKIKNLSAGQPAIINIPTHKVNRPANKTGARKGASR